jgi:hypothetical protein
VREVLEAYGWNDEQELAPFLAAQDVYDQIWRMYDRQRGGESGASWSIGDHVLRVGRHLGEERLALSAAAEVLPVPRVIGHVDLGDCTGTLLERLPGRPAGEWALSEPGRAHVAGAACGAPHALLAEIPAPAVLRSVGTPERDTEARLLHLDLHPFNVLVDDTGAVTGVIDWANAAAGAPVLDRARSWSILTLDPGALSLQSNAGWVTLTDAWMAEGRLTSLPASARAWACEFMLDDLAKRHSAPALVHVVQALSDARAEGHAGASRAPARGSRPGGRRREGGSSRRPPT